jgi:hypothetical protein
MGRIMEEKLYTLDEAKTELRKRECDYKGHMIVEAYDTDGELAKIFCDNCGRNWTVVDPDGTNE